MSSSFGNTTPAPEKCAEDARRLHQSTDAQGFLDQRQKLLAREFQLFILVGGVRHIFGHHRITGFKLIRNRYPVALAGIKEPLHLDAGQHLGATEQLRH